MQTFMIPATVFMSLLIYVSSLLIYEEKNRAGLVQKQTVDGLDLVLVRFENTKPVHRTVMTVWFRANH